jgi:hypothetical protein
MRCQSLLHVGVYCKSLAGQVLIKGSGEIEITGREIETLEKVVPDLLAIAP